MMRVPTRFITPIVFTLLLAGCAGGWRNAPPGTEAGGPASGPSPAARPAAATSVPEATLATSEGVTFVWKGSGTEVALAGEFNGWNTTADPMTKQSDGVWTLTKKLEPGRYPYKFVIDGTLWQEDPSARESIDDGHGGKNSVVVVGDGAAAPAPAPAGTASTPAGAAPAGKGIPPQVTPDGVRFSFAGPAQSVALAGEFNGWSTSTDPLAKQADGTWTIVKKLPVGTHLYKFVVNGTTWKHDDSNPETRDDNFGGKNSVVVVP